MRLLRPLAVTGTLLLGAISCGGSDGGGGSSATDSSAFAAEYCALYLPCCASSGLPAGQQQGCRSFFGAAPPLDASAVQGCLDAYKEQAKSPDFCGLALPQPEICKKAFAQNTTSTGKKQPGEACSTGADCAASSMGDVTCDKVCQVATHAKLGEACVGTVYAKSKVLDGGASGATLPLCHRSEGVTCEGSVCTKLGDAGEACASDSTCLDALYCSSGKCTQRRPSGSPCAANPSACDATSYCDTFGEKVCKALIAEGEKCDTNDQCTTGYCYPDKCAKRAGGGAGFALLLYCQ